MKHVKIYCSKFKKRSKEFEGKTNLTNVYVLAEEKLQEKIWQDMQQHLNLGVLPERYISRNLYELIRRILPGCGKQKKFNRKR